ncbi:MAG: polyprenyl synthetase family protein [Planctomycetales bacterium]|nr:polyprenyl synthetase family protein [Planctomycetales bacterium]
MSTAQPLTTAMADLYSPVVTEMGRVEQLLTEQMRSEYPAVDELVRYGCMLGGKRMRPALLLLVGQASGEVVDAHITLGAVVEMIHTATLVHDDVLDEAKMRRHLATVNSRWDNEASVLLGDYLFTHSFYLASTLETTLGCRWIGHATNVVCEGELRQKAARGNLHLSEDEYLSIIGAKTAALTACSSKLGAYFAGADEATTAEMDAFGYELGVAFQIADDLLDVVGSEADTGKSLGTDLDQKIMTLPLIHTLRCAEPGEREELETLLAGEARSAQLAPYLKRHQALAYARRRAEEFALSARARLDCLPPSPALDALIRMTEVVVRRSC